MPGRGFMTAPARRAGRYLGRYLAGGCRATRAAGHASTRTGHPAG